MEFDQIPETALRWYARGQGAALATVINTWGSAPRPVGSQMAVSGRGEMMGSVSGGCVEAAVVLEACAAITDQTPRILRYGVTDETAFETGLACGGSIEILVEPVGDAPQAFAPDLLRALVAARAARQPVACVTDLATWARVLVPHSGMEARFRSDTSGCDAAGRMITLHNPPLRLIVVGAVHIAQALLPMARLAGFTPLLIDPRAAFATQTRFPGETILQDWPDTVLASIGLDARTAVVTLTHDAKLDDPAIIAALQADVVYLGCLGSTRTHAQRCDRLRAAGLTEAQLSRIHAPVGLDIGARSPAEIAIATLAQITLALRGAR